MAINSGSVSVNVVATQAATVGVASVLYRPQVNISRNYTNGTTTNDQADLIGSFRAPMTTGSPLSVDLLGGQLVDGNSVAISPVEAVAIVLEAPAANAANITVTTSSTNQWDAAVDGVITLPPGGFLAVGVPAGYAITAGTADLMACSGTTGDFLNIVLLGRSA